jgi:hypothetical protein
MVAQLAAIGATTRPVSTGMRDQLGESFGLCSNATP